MSATLLPDVTVQRVSDATGSHIEPQLDQDWPDSDKLAWQVAVVAADTGLRCRVFMVGPDEYSVNVPSGRGWRSLSSVPFGEAWRMLSLFSIGAEAFRDSLDHRARP